MEEKSRWCSGTAQIDLSSTWKTVVGGQRAAATLRLPLTLQLRSSGCRPQKVPQPHVLANTGPAIVIYLPATPPTDQSTCANQRT